MINLTAAVRKFFVEREARSEKRAHREGFDWIAGELLRGEKTVEELEQLHSTYVWEWTSFDTGANDALTAYYKLKRPKMADRENFEHLLLRMEQGVEVWSISGPTRIRSAIGELRMLLKGL